jgi:hypothetical protein
MFGISCRIILGSPLKIASDARGCPTRSMSLLNSLSNLWKELETLQRNRVVGGMKMPNTDRDQSRSLGAIGFAFLCVGLIGFALLIRWGY